MYQLGLRWSLFVTRVREIVAEFYAGLHDGRR